MKNTTKAFAAFLLVLTLSVATFTSVASAATEDGKMKGEFMKRDHNHEHMEEMKEAIEDEDYDTWYDLMVEHPHGEEIVELVTQDNFDLFIDMMEAKMAGEHEIAQELREELGLPEPHHHKMRQGKRFQENQEIQ